MSPADLEPDTSEPASGDDVQARQTFSTIDDVNHASLATAPGPISELFTKALKSRF